MEHNAVLNESRIYRLSALSDTAMPTLAVRYSMAPRAGELPSALPSRATITISATGGTGSKLLITVKQYVRDTAGTETVGTTTSINGAAYTTLSAIVDALNAIPGIVAWVLHAPHSYSTDSNDFIALAETDIRADGRYLETLYRDASEVHTAYLRIGNPQVWDKGRLLIKRIFGSATGVTNGTVKLVSDEYGKDQVVHLNITQVAALTQYLADNIEQAQPYKCPLLLIVASDDLSAADYSVQAVQAEDSSGC